MAFVLDRTSQKPAIIASTEGGVEIEEVAKNNPSAIIVEPFDPISGPSDA